MAQPFQFGSGIVWATPSATSGNPAVNPTPQLIGTIQAASVEFAGTIKELIGYNQFPDDTAVGEKKVSGKITTGRIEMGMFNQIFFGDVASTGTVNMQYNEAHAIPATPFQVTPTPPNSGVYAGDLGVIYGTGTTNPGQRLTKLPTGTPATGQYTVNSTTGQYTFAAADTLLNVLISYQYTVAAAGVTYQINNQVMGYGPLLALDLLWAYQSAYTQTTTGPSNALGIHLYACRMSKVSLPAKNTDYVIAEMDFSAFANGAGQVGYFIQNAA